MGELAGTNVAIVRDDDGMPTRLLYDVQVDSHTTGRASSDVPEPTAAAGDPFLTVFNANVKACEACAGAQQAMDDEYMDDYVAWCDEHHAQIDAWWLVQRVIRAAVVGTGT